MNPRRWLQEHSLKLLAIRDTPEAIAGGVAIGIYFWFFPVPGLKTIGAIFVAWLTRSNILAAVITVTLHDVLLPVMLVLYRYEYCIGYWLITSPHRWPQRLSHANWLVQHRWTEWRLYWRTFSAIGKPLLVGSFILGMPVSAISYFVTRTIVARHQKKKQAAAAAPADSTVSGAGKD
jgi:uncharacterized protein (DUF2062 family)